MADAQKSEKPFQVVFSDGACTDNGRDDARAGIGVFWNDEDDRNVSELRNQKQMDLLNFTL